MNWYLFIGLALVAWFCQNVTHELSHLWSGWLWEGRRPKKLIPWPHMYEKRFYWARYDSGPPSKNGTPRHRYSAPLRWACVQFCVSISLFCVLIIRQDDGWAYFLPFLLAPLIDSSVWMWGYLLNRPGTDGALWEKWRRIDRGIR